MIYYTYHIGWTEHNMHYYGVRGTNTSTEEDLWVRYFSSSKYVKQFRAEHGEPNVVEVRRTFGSARSQALAWEKRVLVRIKAPKSPHWLNRYASTYHGAVGPKNHGWKISLTTKGRKRNVDVVNRINKNPEKIKKTALAHTGMIRSDQAKVKMSVARKAFIASNGGPLNKNKKMYYDPTDHTQTKLCYPSEAPVGWVAGNPKARGRHPYINQQGQIKWWRPEEVVIGEWRTWNANNNNHLIDVWHT